MIVICPRRIETHSSSAVVCALFWLIN